MELKWLALWCMVTVLASVMISHAIPQSPEIQYVRGERIRVPVGEVVSVHTTIKAINGQISGTLKVEVKKDIVGGSDAVHKTLSKYVYARNGEVKVVDMGQFTASDKTCTGLWCVRQYFIKVYFNDRVIYDPSDPKTRECVETY